MAKKALMLGKGKSGEASATLLRSCGYDVDFADGYDLVVASPGLPVKSELQLGCEELRRSGWKLLAVTGSKGKSSVVKLVADALGGVPCGNYGTPVTALVQPSTFNLQPSTSRWAVVEASSFQLETTNLPPETFEAAAILNLQEDHLDRHGSVEAYHALKRRLLTMTRRPIDASTLPSLAPFASLLSGSYFDNPVLRDCRAPSLESLGNSAFRNCSVLTNVTVGSHCTNLGYQAFVYCAQLRTLTPSFARGAVFPDGTQGFMQNCYEFRSPLVFDSPLPLTFAQNAFQNLTNLTQVVFKSRVQSMDGAWCFQGLKQAVDFYFYGAAPESVGNDVVKGPNNRWVRFYVNRDYADTWTNLLEAGNPGLGDHPGEKTLGKLKNNNVWVVSWRVPTKGLLLLIR